MIINKNYVIQISILSRMFGQPDDDFLDMLMSGKGEQYLDRQIDKMRKEIGEDEFQQFAEQYFRKQGTQNIYAGTEQINEQKQEQIKEKQEDVMAYLTEIPDKKKQQHIPETETHERENEEIEEATCEEEQELKEISRELVEGTTNIYNIKYNNGDQYQGEIQGNSKSGWGTYFYSNGEKYDGCFIQDEIHGYGHYYFNGGAQYEGDWSSGMKHGIGILKIPKNTKYEGMFCRDQFHGTGKYQSQNGDIYDGQWKFGKKHGKGTFEGKDGRLMIGYWKEGQFSVD